VATEGRDELGRKSDGGLIFKQHADPAAELNDQARYHRPDKLDLDELNALTLGTRQAARLLWSGWNPGHPANLPATADRDHGVNFTTLTRKKRTPQKETKAEKLRLDAEAATRLFRIFSQPRTTLQNPRYGGLNWCHSG
jgi:hypothetical protein